MRLAALSFLFSLKLMAMPGLPYFVLSGSDLCPHVDCSIGYYWNGSGWDCIISAAAPEANYAVDQCLNLNSNQCIKDFTGVSTLVAEIVLVDYGEPNPDELNCGLPTYPSDMGRGLEINAVHPEYSGFSATTDAVYTVTIRVRGVFEYKQYTNKLHAPMNGHEDPQQANVYVLDPYYVADSMESVSSGGENEYHFKIYEYQTDFSAATEHKYMLNNRNIGGLPGLQSVDYTFKVQLRAGNEVLLGGTSVDAKEYPNTATSSFTPFQVGGSGIKRTEPYSGQFLQLNVVSISY